MTAFIVFGRRLESDDPAFASALEEAHAQRHRPLCLCNPQGLEMYVSRAAGQYVLKRMPFTGSLHAPTCRSYDAPPEASGLGQLLGSAIQEDPSGGTTLLRLAFPVFKTRGHVIDIDDRSDAAKDARAGMRLSLRGLLHYLWDEGELTRWQPGFAGRRTWATVRRHLLGASAGKFVRGQPLLDRLYVPETFSVEGRDEISARRRALWARASAPTEHRRELLIAVAEVKGISATRWGASMVVKHVPDQAFWLDDRMYRQVKRRFESQLSLWATYEASHLLAIFTFGLQPTGTPAVDEMSLMLVSGHWLPVEDDYEIQLVDRLVRDGRQFKKLLRYELDAKLHLSVAILLDTDPPCALDVSRREGEEEPAVPPPNHELARWRWIPREGQPPPFPCRRPTPTELN